MLASAFYESDPRGGIGDHSRVLCRNPEPCDDPQMILQCERNASSQRI